MSARKRWRKLKLSHVHRYHNFQFWETDQCRLLCIWVITQRSFVTTQITATQTLLNKNEGRRVQIVNTSGRLPAKICNDKHSSKADLTLQDINTTLIELQQSWVSPVNSCFALLRAHQCGASSKLFWMRVLNRRASATLSQEENYPPWKVWQLKKVCANSTELTNCGKRVA